MQFRLWGYDTKFGLSGLIGTRLNVSVHLLIFFIISLFIYFYLFIYLFTCLFIYLFIYLSIYSEIFIFYLFKNIYLLVLKINFHVFVLFTIKFFQVIFYFQYLIFIFFLVKNIYLFISCKIKCCFQVRFYSPYLIFIYSKIFTYLFYNWKVKLKNTPPGIIYSSTIITLHEPVTTLQ